MKQLKTVINSSVWQWLLVCYYCAAKKINTKQHRNFRKSVNHFLSKQIHYSIGPAHTIKTYIPIGGSLLLDKFLFWKLLSAHWKSQLLVICSPPAWASLFFMILFPPNYRVSTMPHKSAWWQYGFSKSHHVWTHWLNIPAVWGECQMSVFSATTTKKPL